MIFKFCKTLRVKGDGKQEISSRIFACDRGIACTCLCVVCFVLFPIDV